MELFRKQKGQTIIETALILVLLLFILFGITEFARAWYMKNSLKNAARQGARVAVVTSQSSYPANFMCDNTTDCNDPNLNPIIRAVCCQPGVPRKAAPENTSVTLECRDDLTNNIIPCNTVAASNTVRVTAQTNFQSVVSSRFWPWLQNIAITTDASMRYE